MKQIADKLNSMSGIRVLKDRPSQLLFLDKFHWLQFLCSDKESLDVILRACNGANTICKLEEGWGTDEVPKDAYVYTLLIEQSAIEPFKSYMGMPHIVSGGIKPIYAKDISMIKDLMSGMGIEETEDENAELKKELQKIKEETLQHKEKMDFDQKVLYGLLGLMGLGIFAIIFYNMIYKS